jgi:MFS transporter, MHS family, dicarboxylic acid transporter PcaT
VGALLSGPLLLFRDKIHKTVTPFAHKAAGSLKSLMRPWRSLEIVVIIAADGGFWRCTFTTDTQEFLVNRARMNLKTAGGLVSCAMIVFMRV